MKYNIINADTLLTIYRLILNIMVLSKYKSSESKFTTGGVKKNQKYGKSRGR